jgi:hypothetical protein
MHWALAPDAQDQYFKDKYGVTDERLENTIASLQSTLNRFQGVQTKKLFTDVYLITGPTPKKHRWFW